MEHKREIIKLTKQQKKKANKIDETRTCKNNLTRKQEIAFKQIEPEQLHLYMNNMNKSLKTTNTTLARLKILGTGRTACSWNDWNVFKLQKQVTLTYQFHALHRYSSLEVDRKVIKLLAFLIHQLRLIYKAVVAVTSPTYLNIVIWPNGLLIVGYHLKTMDMDRHIPNSPSIWTGQTTPSTPP